MTKKQTSSTEEITIQIINDETKLGILMALYYFESLNLTQIAMYTGKTKPTIYHHIKSLAELEMIQLDQASIAKTGKFYRLTKSSEKIFSMADIDFSQIADKLENNQSTQSSENLELFSQLLQTFSIMAKNNAFFTSSYIEDNYDRYKQKEDELKPLDLLTINIEIKKEEQRKKLVDAIDNFTQTVISIVQESQQIDTEPISKQFLYLFTSPISQLSEMMEE